MTRNRGPAIHPEQGKPFIEPAANLVNAEDIDHRRGEFDGQGNSVEAPANIRDRCRDGIVDLEIRGSLMDSSREQPYRRITLDVLGRRRKRRGRDLQWIETPYQLSFDPQGFARRREDVDFAGVAQCTFSEESDILGDMLAGIQDEQQAPAMEGKQYLIETCGDVERQMKRARDCRIDLIFAGNSIELDKTNSVGIKLFELVCHGKRHGRLADAAGPKDRDETILLQKLPEVADHHIAANRRGRRGRHARPTLR